MDIDLTLQPGDGRPVTEFERLRSMGPIFRSDSLGGWLVFSYEDVRAVLSATSRFTSEGTPISHAFGREAMLVVDDTTRHHHMRAVWAKQVAARALDERAAQIERIVRRLLEPVAAAVRDGKSVDLVPVFQSFTGEVITWLMGLPAERIGDLLRWNRALSDTPVLDMAPDSPALARHLATRKEVLTFLHAALTDRTERLSAGEPPVDLVASVAAAVGSNGITPAIALDNLLNLFIGAVDTTVKWLGNIVTVLHRHPQALAEIRRDPGLLPKAAEEVMRFETAAQLLMRLVKSDGTVLAGRELEAGERIYVLPGAANRDPAVFDEPDRFDIHRRPVPHLGFGSGLHHCLGANIARKEVTTFVRALLEMIPDARLVEVDYGVSWALWGPVRLLIGEDRSLSSVASRQAAAGPR